MAESLDNRGDLIQTIGPRTADRIRAKFAFSQGAISVANSAVALAQQAEAAYKESITQAVEDLGIPTEKKYTYSVEEGAVYEYKERVDLN